MRRVLIVAWITVVALFPVAMFSQKPSQGRHSGPMTDAEYKASLAQIEAAVPKWEVSFKSINPERDERVSYSFGKIMVASRDTALKTIELIRKTVAQERVKHTVSGGLSLALSLDGLDVLLDNEVNLESAAH